MLIGHTQLHDKLVFIASRPKLSVIANQSADWCGNPPVREEMYRQLPNRVGIVAFLVEVVTWFHGAGGLPHQESGLVRNDSVF